MIFFRHSSLLSSFILFSLLATTPIAIGMEREQDKPMEHKNAHLSLTSPVFFSVDPNPFSSYIIHFKNKPHRYFNDPLIRTKLSFASTSLSIAIPVKHFFNLNDGSELRFILESKNTKPVHISAFCTKNILMPDTCFKNQFERMMASFYRSPICTANSVRTSIEEEVILKENISDAAPIDGDIEVRTWETGVSTFQHHICVKNCMHGTKGCPDEKTFISLITKSKTKPYNKSLYQLHMNRQTGAKKNLRAPSATNLDLILDNCLKEMECAEIAAEKLLDDCFKELAIMIILARSLIVLPIIKECAASLLKKSRPL